MRGAFACWGWFARLVCQPGLLAVHGFRTITVQNRLCVDARQRFRRSWLLERVTAASFPDAQVRVVAHRDARPVRFPYPSLWISAALAIVTRVRARHPSCREQVRVFVQPQYTAGYGINKSAGHRRSSIALARCDGPALCSPWYPRLFMHRAEWGSSCASTTTHIACRARRSSSQHCAAVLRISLQRVCVLSVSVAASRPLRLLFPVCYSRALTPMAACSLHSTCSLDNDGSRRAKMVDVTPLAIVIGASAEGTVIGSASEAERASAHRRAHSSGS